MPRPLPGAWNLITDSWTAFIKTWDTTVRISAWFIPAVILENLYVFIPSAQEGVRSVVAIVGIVAGVLLMIWAGLKLYVAALTIEDGKKTLEKTDKAILALLPSLILVGILEILCTVGGFIVLILPGIYISIRLGFSQLSLIDKGTKGRQALIASWGLTKNRFWAIFGRELGAGLLFVILMMAVLMVAMALVGLVAGSAFTNLMKDAANPMGESVSGIISSIVQAALVPLLAIYQVKLYRALEKTR